MKLAIQSVFQLGSERIAIRIIGDNVLFIDFQTNMMSPIEGLQLSKEGTIKEYPDLKDDKEWKNKAIQRFVDKIKSLPSETERNKWLIEEMKKMNYTPLYSQRNGFRPQKIKWKMAILDTIVQVLVITGFGIWAYSKVKRQSVKDTFDEIKNLISKMREREYG